MTGPASYKTLVKLYRDIASLRIHNKGYWFDGTHSGDVLDDRLILAITNTFFLRLISVFDDLLEEYIAKYYPGNTPRRFINRLEFLISRGDFLDPKALMALKDERDEYAHDAEKYADWAALEKAREVVNSELKHLGIGFAWRSRGRE